MVDRLAAMDVGDMQLENRSREHLQCVKDGDRSEGEAGRIDDNACTPIDRLVNPVDDLVFGVRLPKLDWVASRGFAAHRFDLGERRRAVDLRFSLAEPVQVRPVEHVNWLGHSITPLMAWSQPW